MALPTPRPSWTLRHAGPDDLTAVVDIYNAAIPSRLSTAEPLPVPVAEKRAWFDAHDPDRRPLMVLEEDGQIIGWVELKNHYGRRAYAKTAEIGVYLAQDRLGQGIGRYLVGRMIDRCPALGVTTLLAICFADNAASVQMFAKLGFERWGFYPGIAELDGRPRDIVHLGLRLA